MQIADRGVHDDLVLPLELDPHLSELVVGAGGRNDVVHDVDVNVIQHDTVPIGLRTADIVDDVPEDDSVLCRGHLDVRLDVREVVRRHGDRLRLLDQFQVAEGRQLQSEIL